MSLSREYGVVARLMIVSQRHNLMDRQRCTRHRHPFENQAHSANFARSKKSHRNRVFLYRDEPSRLTVCRKEWYRRVQFPIQ